jgi:hypothetical protein
MGEEIYHRYSHRLGVLGENIIVGCPPVNISPRRVGEIAGRITVGALIIRFVCLSLTLLLADPKPIRRGEETKNFSMEGRVCMIESQEFLQRLILVVVACKELRIAS